MLALIGGGALVTPKISARFRDFFGKGLAGKPTQQARAQSLPLGFARFIAGVFVVCGMVAIPVSIVMMVRS
ncbi:hypothetical protein [Streptomyces chartreusis]